MWSQAVVKVEVTADRIPGLADAFVGPQIHFLIFDAAPQPLDEDIVTPSPFGLDQHRRYHELVMKYGTRAVPSSTFVSGLIQDRVLHPIAEHDVAPSSLAMYYDAGSLKHAGVVISPDRRVRSKWGGNELFEHPVMEVPAPYGDEVRYFLPPSEANVQEILRRLIRELGE